MREYRIKKGEFMQFQSLKTDKLVVNGVLEVQETLNVKQLSGHGRIICSSLYAESVEAELIDAKALIDAKHIWADSLFCQKFHSETASVSLSCKCTWFSAEQAELPTAVEIGNLDCPFVCGYVGGPFAWLWRKWRWNQRDVKKWNLSY